MYPSRMDTFGGVIVEAAVCGTPVVTTPLPAHSLNLQLLYADKVEEFVKIALKVYNLWRQNTGQYDKLAQRFRKQALIYDIGNVFPRFEKMLVQVEAGREFLSESS
jgi:glycosyltransferase involved in cell wall biosynthesis